MNKIFVGNALDMAKKLEDNSINAIVTSPPYWGLRDYGEDTNTKIWDGDFSCDHVWGKNQPPLRSSWGDVKSLSKKQSTNRGSLQNISAMESSMGNFCQNCSAWKGQLGLEPDYKLFIKHLVDIFEALKPKLKKDGSLWVNLGDTYSGLKVGNTDLKNTNVNSETFTKPKSSVKSKSQIGIPERFKIAMIDNGWICRNTIIWHKPNVMPQSAKDRYTNDFEYFFFFTKNKKYYFKQQVEENNRNKRSTWSINTKSFKESHFAVFPRELIKSPIDACVPKKNGVVLDPFFGSGTVGVEALWQDVNYIGFEVNPKYVDIAKKRLRKETMKKSRSDKMKKQREIF